MASTELKIKFSINTDLELPAFEEFEKEYLTILYVVNKGNIFHMVKQSQISRATIYRKLIHYFGDFRKALNDTK